jgi:very-short-patch-repair endonuclease
VAPVALLSLSRCDVIITTNRQRDLSGVSGRELSARLPTCRFLLPGKGPGFAVRARSSPGVGDSPRLASPRLSQNLRAVGCARRFAGQKELVLSSSFQARSQSHRKSQLAKHAQSMRHAGTESERILWASIRGSALGVQFRRQVPIAGLFIGDFVASEVKLIVEVDGNWHARRGTADSHRDTKLRRLGFTVLRLPVTLVERQLPVALQRIRDAIAALSSAP